MRSNEEMISIIENRATEKGMTLSELARQVGMAKSAISRYFNRTREFPVNKVDIFAKALNLSPQYILGFEEDSKITTIYDQLDRSRKNKVYGFAEKQLNEQQKENNNVVKLSDYVEEKLNGAVSAGTGEYLFEDVHETIRIPKSRIPNNYYDIILQVNGDSMQPMFEDHEYIFIKKTEEIRSGQIGVFIIDGESYLKKAYLEDDHLRLVSLNKKYNDLIFDSVNDIKVIGTVVL